MIIIPVHNRSEIEACADIWLQASLAAHDFVSADFWHENHAAMKEQYLPGSDCYLAKEEEAFLGFAAVYQGALAALFVRPVSWSKGGGSELLRHVQDLYAELTLTVYSRNSRAVNFYLRHGFAVSKEQACQHTGEPELLMLWKGTGS
ncbi:MULTISPECIES: GNAT family N-acetyltransferase [unclassified Desulfovibrio]|uniref:GNAT family N-acetyltransferase n=1 Tax=unclassified Desulfovibrio TaxID=2593640 RepID=UPI002FD9373F